MPHRTRALTVIALLGVLGLSTPSAAQRHPDSLLSDLRWRNIGPATMMGRISAVDALHDDYRTVLIGSASGWVWKSTNAGNTVEPLFDEYGNQSIGDDSWTELTNGLPTGDTGQINVDMYRENPDILMAYVETDDNLPPTWTHWARAPIR